MNNSVKLLIENNLKRALQEARPSGLLSREDLPPIFISQPKREEWGDLSTNLPFLLSQKWGCSTSGIAQILIASLQKEYFLSRVQFAPPGFINFFISPSHLHQTLEKILTQEEKFTCFSYGEGRRVQVEFVSANPTGPLHVGHGRAAAVGDSLANILSKAGYQVQKEYYVNDVGGQIERLSRSVRARLEQLQGKKVSFPEDGYRGDYVIQIAKEAKDELGDEFPPSGKLSPKTLKLLGDFTVRKILDKIKEDLTRFGIKYHSWVTESNFHEAGRVLEVISSLKDKGFVYEREGALWFKTSEFFEDQEDRVLRRKSGEYTYFASDIAYHQDKFQRGLDWVIDVWGADHIGYVPRMKAAIQALGYPGDYFRVIIYQLVTLKRGKKRISASTRQGEFIPLSQVLDEVGKDAARFFFLSRTSDSHLDFDLELAKKQTPENPVFYVQYAHARISSILNKARNKGIKIPPLSRVKLNLLVAPEERKLMRELCLLPDMIKEAGESLEPHRLTTWLQSVATIFHQFYTLHQVIGQDEDLSSARLLLVKAVQITLRDVLSLLGISAPEKM
jgi:arginyl-tRNA synthetase